MNDFQSILNEYENAKISEAAYDATKPIVDVSIVAANYNNGPYLESFFYSLSRSDTYPREAIIVDDGSTDNSRQILEAACLKLPFVKIIYLKANQGFANALNHAIMIASSNILVRIDPDDIFMKDRIRTQYEYMNLHPDVDAVGSNAVIFDSTSKRPITMTNFPIGRTNIAQRFHAGEHGVLHPTVMVRREAFSEISYIQENVPAEDYDIFARMSQSGRIFENIERPLILYRAHARSASTNLKFSLIKKTYNLRDSIYKTKTNKLQVIRYFIFIYSYRRYLFNTDKLNRTLFGATAALMAPGRTIRRLLRLTQ